MKLKASIWNKYLIGFTFLLSYLNVISYRVATAHRIDWYTFTPEGPIFDLLHAMVIYRILKYLVIDRTTILQDKVQWTRLIIVVFTGLVLYIILANLFGLTVSTILGNFERNYQPFSLVINRNIRFIVSYFLFGIIYIAYVFYNKNIQQEKYLKKVEETLNQSNLSNLRAQLNPHFLFNNLNSLDELIHTDQDKASDFLADFADIYRFCLDNANQHLISLREELSFAQSYFDMMIQKYPNEYELEKDNFEEDDFLIPPFSCQTLIENVIEHNRPHKDKQIHIYIFQKEEYLVIQNNKGLKARKTMESGKAIDNLKTQFKLLETAPVLIEDGDDNFTVKIPLIHR